MTDRVSRAVVTFAQPFFVEGVGRNQPAGTYEVETVEEPIEGLSFLAYRTVSTSIVIPRCGGGKHDFQMARIAASVVQAARLETENTRVSVPTREPGYNPTRKTSNMVVDRIDPDARRASFFYAVTLFLVMAGICLMLVPDGAIEAMGLSGDTSWLKRPQ